MKKDFFRWRKMFVLSWLLITVFFAFANKNDPENPAAVYVQPVLTAATGASVDASFTVTFTDDAAWRAAINSITIRNPFIINSKDVNLPASAYIVTAGHITFLPAASALLQSSGTRDIKVYATGYPFAEISSQNISAGADKKLFVTTQPAAPAINGAVFAVQPVVLIQDQYGNTTSSVLTVVASVGAGAWSLGGTAARTAVNGSVTFTDLSAGGTAAVGGATITFSAYGITGATSGAFNIPPPYGVCSGALTIPWGESVTADNTYATTETSGSPCSISPDGLVKGIWFKVTSPVSGPVTISTCGTAMDTYLRVYTGSCASFSACAGFNDDNAACLNDPSSSAASFTATANTTYYILCGLFDASKKGGIVTISAFSTIVPPSLTAAAGATADAAFSITFTDDVNWRNLITKVVYQNTLLQPGIDYTIIPGAIILRPDGTAGGILGKAGTYLLTVEAAGYSIATVYQSVLHGIPAIITMSTQPAAPGTNGGTLAKQPAVTVADQYGNMVGSGFMVNVTVTAGQESTWSLGGTLSTSTISNSIATFSGLTATNQTGTAYPSATLTFTAGSAIATSAVFTLPPHSATLPTVTTLTASSVGSVAAFSGGEVTSDGYAAISARGVVWDFQPTPVITLVTKTSDGSGSGTFTSFLSPLIANTHYYYRSYATNRTGTNYGTENDLVTLPITPVVMPAVKITLNSFTAQWNEPGQGSAFPVTYEIQVSTDPDDFSNPVIVITGITETAGPQQHLIDSGLKDGTAYYYIVRAVTDAGYSSWSPVSPVAELPVITLAAGDNEESVTSGTIAGNSIDNILNHTQLIVTNGTGILDSVTCTTPGVDDNCNYTNADISGFKLWYSTDNDFASKIQVGRTFVSGKTDPAGPETIIFPSLALVLPVNTYYFWITGDVLNGAGNGHTITVNAPVYTAVTGTVINGCHSSAKQTIVTEGIPLPVELSSFSVARQTGSITINWSVTGESDVLSYEVESGSNGIDFEEIGDVKAVNTDNEQSYNWIDNKPATGISYYRLKITDVTGKIQYSQVVKIIDNRDSKKGIIIYPNPIVNGAAVLQMNNLPAGVYTVSLYNNAGSLVKRQILYHPDGNECISIRMATGGRITGGIYTVTVSSSNGIQCQEKVMMQ